MGEFTNQAIGDVSGSAYDFISNRMDSVLKMVVDSSIFVKLLGYFEALGIVLLVLYFALDMIDKASTDNFNLEGFFHQMLKFLPGYFLITNLHLFIPALLDFVIALNGEIATTFLSIPVQDGNKVGIISQMMSLISSSSLAAGPRLEIPTPSNAGVLDAIFTMILCLGYKVIIQFFLLYLSISRALQVSYRATMAPIAIADIYQNGTTSNGIKQLKKLFALFLQSTIVMLLCIVIDAATMSDGLSSYWAGLICIFVLIGAFKKVEQFSARIVGVS